MDDAGGRESLFPPAPQLCNILGHEHWSLGSSGAGEVFLFGVYAECGHIEEVTRAEGLEVSVSRCLLVSSLSLWAWWADVVMLCAKKEKQ